MKLGRPLLKRDQVVPKMKNKKEKSGKEESKDIIVTESRNAPLKTRPKQNVKNTEETSD